MSDRPNIPSLAEALSPDVVSALIASEIEPLKERGDALVASCRRFIEAYPTIETPEADSKAAEVLAVCAAFSGKSGRVETTRVAFKKPILEADGAIGSLNKGPFAKVAELVETAAVTIRRASIEYKQRVENERRKAAQEEADRQAASARLAERMAARGSTTVTDADAANASHAAAEARLVADSRPAELTRTHGEIGTTSLRYKRVVTVVEPDKVPRMYCVPDIAAITRAAGKAGTPFPKIEGCSISDTPDLTVRK